MTTNRELDAELDRISGLAEGQRRSLYTFVTSAGRAVSRDEAAAAVGISRPLAAYHLDRLVDDGLLDVRFERRTGRRGPGAGRPAKLYQRSQTPLELSVPARDYAFLAELLAVAVERDSSGEAQAALWRIAHDTGASAAEPPAGEPIDQPEGLGLLRQTLADRGYEPYQDDHGNLRLRNCPFHRLAEHHRQLTCNANLAFITGLAERAVPNQPVTVWLDPRPGECCVTITPTEH